MHHKVIANQAGIPITNKAYSQKASLSRSTTESSVAPQALWRF